MCIADSSGRGRQSRSAHIVLWILHPIVFTNGKTNKLVSIQMEMGDKSIEVLLYFNKKKPIYKGEAKCSTVCLRYIRRHIVTDISGSATVCVERKNCKRGDGHEKMHRLKGTFPNSIANRSCKDCNFKQA